MARIADPLREYVGAVRAYHLTDIHGKKREYVDATTRELLEIADAINNEHARRMSQSRREVRRDFARYMRSCIADYVDGTARRNRNHAHAKVTNSDEATCTQCGTSIGTYDNYCRRCGAKLTAIEYEEASDS